MKPPQNPTPEKNTTKRTKGTGWSPERRAAQSARLKASKIWLKSTGPKTSMGKKIAAQNARKSTLKMDEINAFLSAQNRWRKNVESWGRLRESRLASKATFSAVCEAKKYRAKLAFLLGIEGRKLVEFGIKFLRENNV